MTSTTPGDEPAVPDGPEAMPEGSTPAPTERAPARKAPARKAPARKAPARKAPARKAPAGKAAATKSSATKTPARKAAAGAATRRRSTGGSRPAPEPVEIAATHRRHPFRTLEERVARGIRWRSEAPFAEMAGFEPAASRPSALSLLRAQDDARVPELLPIRYGRMGASAFAYYRGSAAVMAYDLAQQPRTPGATQICGDAHLSNFGFFGSPERDLVFDVNDFDETLPGPFEWDVKRLAASVVLAARDRGFRKKESRAATLAAVEGYRNAAQRLAGVSNLDVWYTKVDAAQIEEALLTFARQEGGKKFEAAARARLDSIFGKARGKTSLRAAEKLTEVVDGARRFRNAPPLLARADLTPEETAQVEQTFVQYKESLQNDRRRLVERFRFVDIAQKVVGVGSVGTRALILLMEGRDDKDLLVLQVKQAQQSVLEAYLRPSVYDNHGQRVVEGQRYMQTASDIFLGWLKGPQGRHFYVRQLHDMKGSLDLTKVQPVGLQVYARMCGGTLARAHARGGDIVAIASYLGDDDAFAQSVLRFAEAYADQAQADFAELRAAIADGTVEATDGV